MSKIYVIRNGLKQYLTPQGLSPKPPKLDKRTQMRLLLAWFKTNKSPVIVFLRPGAN